MKFANVQTDLTFKRLFGDDQRKNLTINFLNAVLNRKKGNLIKSLTFCDGANIPEIEDYKYSAVDINCIDEAGNRFIIEMQVAHQVYFLLRSQYYVAYALAQQLKKGQKYSTLIPVIFVGIMNHRLFEDRLKAITHHGICDLETRKQSMFHSEYHYIELANFNKTIDELETDLDKWLFFFKESQDLEIIPPIYQNSPDFLEAFHVLEKSLWTPEEQELYRKQLATIHHDDLIQEGLIEKGIEKVAINGLKEGLSLELLQKLTGLSIEQIQSLKKD
jgi:predicted transposase/invertase (TIGR01784 family)